MRHGERRPSCQREKKNERGKLEEGFIRFQHCKILSLPFNYNYKNASVCTRRPCHKHFVQNVHFSYCIKSWLVQTEMYRNIQYLGQYETWCFPILVFVPEWKIPIYFDQYSVVFSILHVQMQQREPFLQFLAIIHSTTPQHYVVECLLVDPRSIKEIRIIIFSANFMAFKSAPRPCQGINMKTWL